MTALPMALELLTQSATHVSTVATNLAAAVPNPGSGSAPPGSDGLLTILRWAAWIAFSVCVLGVIGCGAMMAMSAFSGHSRGGEHVARLGWVLGGCIVIGSAAGLVGALV